MLDSEIIFQEILNEIDAFNAQTRIMDITGKSSATLRIEQEHYEAKNWFNKGFKHGKS